MMNHSGVGFDFVNAYLVPSLPWVTASNLSGYVRHDFAMVTKNIEVHNVGTSAFKIAFTQNGFVSNNCLTVPVSGSFNKDIRIKSLFLSGSSAQYELFAGLTTIQERTMPLLTGSSGLPGSWSGVG